MLLRYSYVTATATATATQVESTAFFLIKQSSSYSMI